MDLSLILISMADIEAWLILSVITEDEVSEVLCFG